MIMHLPEADLLLEHLSSTIKCDEICKNAKNSVTPKAEAKLELLFTKMASKTYLNMVLLVQDRS
jgi:hypothetical protein